MNGSSTDSLQFVEMVSTVHIQNHAAENNDYSDTANGDTALFSQSSQVDQSRAKPRFHNEKLRKPPPAITSAYMDGDWSSENEIIARYIDRDNIDNAARNDPSDDISWKIIKRILQGWCIIWVLFACIVVAAELRKTSHHLSAKNNKIALTITEENEQLFLTISEEIVTKCSYTNLDTEPGREECQSLCHQHMCCFNDETNFGCASNLEKICPAYAGCESLIITEDDAIIYNADGVDVFGVDDGDDAIDLLNASNSSDDLNKSKGQMLNESVPYAISELGLISEVIAAVCSPQNLRTRQQLNECAALCNPSMCCFDREQIEFLNPNVDLILQLEGITDAKLDTSVMGTCLDEGQHKGQNKVHFCQVHAACKNLLLLGSHYSKVDTSFGNRDGENYIVFTVLFAMVVVLSIYLLVFKRAAPVPPPVRGIVEAREITPREEMIEFV